MTSFSAVTFVGEATEFVVMAVGTIVVIFVGVTVTFVVVAVVGVASPWWPLMVIMELRPVKRVCRVSAVEGRLLRPTLIFPFGF